MRRVTANGDRAAAGKGEAGGQAWVLPSPLTQAHAPGRDGRWGAGLLLGHISSSGWPRNGWGPLPAGPPSIPAASTVQGARGQAPDIAGRAASLLGPCWHLGRSTRRSCPGARLRTLILGTGCPHQPMASLRQLHMARATEPPGLGECCGPTGQPGTSTPLLPTAQGHSLAGLALGTVPPPPPRFAAQETDSTQAGAPRLGRDPHMAGQPLAAARPSRRWPGARRRVADAAESGPRHGSYAGEGPAPSHPPATAQHARAPRHLTGRAEAHP